MAKWCIYWFTASYNKMDTFFVSCMWAVIFNNNEIFSLQAKTDQRVFHKLLTIIWWTWFELERHKQIWVKRLHTTHMHHTNNRGSTKHYNPPPCSEIQTSNCWKAIISTVATQLPQIYSIEPASKDSCWATLIIIFNPHWNVKFWRSDRHGSGSGSVLVSDSWCFLVNQLTFTPV